MDNALPIEKQLIKDIIDNKRTGAVATVKLSTDERVLARITDGIYRQPASALRELIANAYDADAENVYIQTDAPRFSKIVVRDDGYGLSPEALARLICHIGGSAKRTKDGIRLGIVDTEDPNFSPNGRRLIGKIGIGLFSVAQLTRNFKIITKRKGDKHRLVAEVLLRTYTEDRPEIENHRRDDFTAGEVQIMSVPATDIDAHGTEIVLLHLRPQTCAFLQSSDLWREFDNADESSEVRQKLKYHIGRLKRNSGDIIDVSESLPWSSTDPADIRFEKLYQAVQDAAVNVENNPRLETLFDNYLRMIWTLSLSAPLEYVDNERHPFNITSSCGLRIFELDHSQGRARPITLDSGQTLRKRLGLIASERGSAVPFNIFVDDIKLMRPLRFRDLTKSEKKSEQPILFVGRAKPDLTTIPWDERGGDLEFEAYFLWAPKIVPKEHRGILVRIGDSSGTLFDESFMKYQVSEMHRLQQLSAEVFVRRGLDAALNIDRESFNYAHPHYQILMKWVHRALRQIATTHKQLAADIREETQRGQVRARYEELQVKVDAELRATGKYQEAAPPDVKFVREGKQTDLFKIERQKGVLAFDEKFVFEPVNERSNDSKAQGAPKKVRKSATDSEYFQEQMKAVAKLLDAYGCFEGMSYTKQQKLLRAIVNVIAGSKR